ncbi:MAG: hypothetical protein AB1635_02130 [Acidobacteriota bacterium]
MTWSYERNGLVIAHQLRQVGPDVYELRSVDFDGYAKVERFRAEIDALRRQMELERALIVKGWSLDVFRAHAA